MHYPEQLPYYFYLGFSYYQLERQDKALDVFRKGVRQIKPDTDHGIVADMYSIMGDLYYSNGLKDSASSHTTLVWCTTRRMSVA